MSTPNSPFAKAYLALIEHITTTVPDIIYIDLDYGQLEMKERPAVAFPCLLLDFTNWSFTQLSRQVEQGNGFITAKLAVDPYSSTSNITPDLYQLAGMKILDLEYDLYKAMQLFNPGIGPMVRTSATSDNRRPGLKVRVMTFSSSFEDKSAKPAPITIPRPPANITDEIL